MELGPLKVYRSCRGGAHRTRKIGKYFGQIEQQCMDSGGERVKINRLGNSLVVRRQWMASDDHEKVLCRPHTPPSPAQSISQAGRQAAQMPKVRGCQSGGCNDTVQETHGHETAQDNRRAHLCKEGKKRQYGLKYFIKFSPPNTRRTFCLVFFG